jgi:hypothetical protein
MAVKTIVIQVYAVGMHHYGRKELHVGVGYKLKREPENKYHANAVSIHDEDSDRKVGYLQRKYADKISPIRSAGLATNTGFYVKPKQQSEFKNKWVGPIQMCNLGFITNVQAVLKDTGLSFKIL